MTNDLKALAEALQAFAPPTKKQTFSNEERRIITGFEEILRFVEQHDRLPVDDEGADIFERLYAVRLGRLRKHPAADELLKPLDTHGILDPDKAWSTPDAPATSTEPPSVDELAAALAAFDGGELTRLQHVRSAEEKQAEKRAADEIARREPCLDFEEFAPLFEQIRIDLKNKTRKTIPYDDFAKIRQGDLFILNGLMAYVAHKGEEFISNADHGHTDARLRVIYDNKTESNLLMRSLQRALSQDDTSRRIIKIDLGPLFGDELSEGDTVSGTLYVLRSQSTHHFVAENRALIHKIGVTSQAKVASRIANAADQATYLLADVDLVAEYQLAGIHPNKFEKILHQIFAPAQLDITIEDRFGKPVQPREWFLVPLDVIDEAIARIQDGTITEYHYNPALAQLIPNTD